MIARGPAVLVLHESGDSNAVDMQTESAALHLDFGAPLGNATVRGAVYSREYERATVALDCSRWEASLK